MYAALGTCPDIAYSVQVLSKFSKNPGEAHWEAVKRVFSLSQGYPRPLVDLWWYWGGTGWAYRCRW